MHLFSISVSLILATLSTRSAANELGDFGITCDTSSLNGSELISHCQRYDSSYDWSSIDLNSCLANINANLSCSSKGKYVSTCTNCSLSGTVLSCLCDDFQLVGQDVSIDLNSCVTNTDGALTC